MSSTVYHPTSDQFYGQEPTRPSPTYFGGLTYKAVEPLKPVESWADLEAQKCSVKSPALNTADTAPARFRWTTRRIIYALVGAALSGASIVCLGLMATGAIQFDEPLGRHDSPGSD